MTHSARVGDFVFVCVLRIDEPECVSANLCIGDRGLYPWHVTGDALVARASRCMMCVLLNRCRMRSILRIGTVASQAEPVACFADHAGIIRAVRVVATETGDAARVGIGNHQPSKCKRYKKATHLECPAARGKI